MSWAVCPVCHCLVDDPEAHAEIERQRVSIEESLGATVAATVSEGTHWPKGLPVALPMTIDPAKVSELRTVGEGAIVTITTEALPALDAYLNNPAPTTAETVAMVRTLARIVRGLSVAVRALIRITIRSLTED